MEITFETIEASAIDEDIFEECLVNSMEAIKWIWNVFYKEFTPITNDSSLSEKKATLLKLWKNTDSLYGEKGKREDCSGKRHGGYDTSQAEDMIIFVCKVDGYIVEYHTGWLADASTGNDLMAPIEAGIFHQHGGSMFRPDQNGSSSWNTGADYALSFLNFCKTQCTGGSLKTDMWLPPISQKWEFFKSHQEAGHLTYTINEGIRSMTVVGQSNTINEGMVLPNNYPVDRLVIDL